MFEQRFDGPGCIGTLVATDAAELGDRELRDAARQFEKLTGFAQAGQFAVLAEIARRDERDAAADGASRSGMEDPYRFAADEVGTELAISKLNASLRLHFAVDLARFPATLKALRNGVIDRSKAQQLVDQLNLMKSVELVAALEAAAIEYAATHTRPQLTAWLRRKVIAVEPQVAEARRVKAVAGRKVAHYPGEDGMGSVLAELDAADAVAVWRMVDQVAQASGYPSGSDPCANTGPTQDRTIDQRRADAFVDLILGRGPAKPKTEVLVTVPAETLAGASDAPGELAGYGPITAEHARQLAAVDATWRRILTDPATGAVAEVSERSYRPGKMLSRAVQTRDGTCRFPGCRRAAAGCDLDHTIPWPEGKTEKENLAALCRSHHLLKTHADWRVEQLAGSVMKWTTPTGRVFHTYPLCYRARGPDTRDPPG